MYRYQLGAPSDRVRFNRAAYNYMKASLTLAFFKARREAIRRHGFIPPSQQKSVLLELQNLVHKR